MVSVVSSTRSGKSSMKQYYSTKNAPNFWSRQQYLVKAVTLLGGVLFLSVLIMSSSNGGKQKGTANAATKEKHQQSTGVSSSRIATSEVGGISYYHCKGASATKKEIPLVMLHGARFTKEDWKTSGILEDLCQRGTSNRRLSVFAVGTCFIHVFGMLVLFIVLVHVFTPLTSYQ